MNRPRALVCYLCGQQYGTASLAIHQPQCYRKKLQQWEVLPQGARGPRPIDPATRQAPPGPGAGKMSGADVDRFNEQQFSGYQQNLSGCPHCGRRFNPEALQVCPPPPPTPPPPGMH